MASLRIYDRFREFSSVSFFFRFTINNGRNREWASKSHFVRLLFTHIVKNFCTFSSLVRKRSIRTNDAKKADLARNQWVLFKIEHILEHNHIEIQLKLVYDYTLKKPNLLVKIKPLIVRHRLTVIMVDFWRNVVRIASKLNQAIVWNLNRINILIEFIINFWLVDKVKTNKKLQVTTSFQLELLDVILN